jgi:protoporphyrinogen oxidase
MTSEQEDPKGRRKFLKAALLATGGLFLAAGGVWVWKETRPRKSILWVKEIQGPSHAIGHRLRKPDFPAPSAEQNTRVLIVGGGIAGLSAARWLKKHGMNDFLLVEMEQELGGNSRGGENKVSRYPWGAHYLPLPRLENTDLIDLLQELGVILSIDAQGLPTYKEEFLCHDPEERLFIQGQWQEGLVPQLGVPPEDRAQIKQFISEMHAFRDRSGADGKPLFAFPLRQVTTDPLVRELDDLTMEAWMQQHAYTSPYLRWYVDYCCRDDYGAGIAQVSAYAGIHYFAARGGKAINASEGAVLTWPEGNAWLARQLALPVADRIRTGQLVIALRDTASGAEADVYDPVANATVTFRAEAIVCAAPQFVTSRLLPQRSLSAAFQYAPWVVANVTVEGLPGGMGAALSWDNVAYEGKSLGYIVATHQRLAGFAGTETVLTWYQPLDDLPPSEARTQALARSQAEWQQWVLADFERMHPGITEGVKDIAVWVWGHGMITPQPGFIWGKEREEAQKPLGHIYFAHSDLSGISVFEEAFDQGIQAADNILTQVLAFKFFEIKLQGPLLF